MTTKNIPLPPTGSQLTCKGWHQEAALRCLLNNLHPDVAEDRDNLIVYGGNGQAARNHQALDDIIHALKNLENNLNILGPKILIDGELAAHEINLDLLDQIKNLEPFGREFEAPVFKIRARINKPKRVGDGTHLQCQLDLDGRKFSAIYFGGAADLLDPDIENLNQQETELIVELADNYFKGRELQFLIRYLI